MSVPRQLLFWGPDGSRVGGWMNVGGPNDDDAEVRTDMVVDGLPLPASSIHGAAITIQLDRLTPYEALCALREWHRVLVPDGVLRLCLVDLDRLIDTYRSGGQGLWVHSWSSAAGNFVTQVLDHGRARTPFTVAFASELLEMAGFVDVTVQPFGVTTSGIDALTSGDRREEETFCLEGTRPSDATCPAPLPRGHVCWSSAPQSGFSVLWKEADHPEDAAVEFDTGSEWRRAAAAVRPARGRGVVCRADVTGLPPDIDVSYRIVGRETDVRATRTAPADPAATFTFAFVADTGIGERSDGLSDGTWDVRDALCAADPLFVLGGGDYAYADSDPRFADPQAAADAWISDYEPLTRRTPMILQYGNHDVFLGERWLDYAEQVPGPGSLASLRCTSFDVGAAHFSGVFAPTADIGVDVCAWLDHDLAEARRRGSRWLIVWQHHPPFSHGSSHPSGPTLRRAVGPVLSRHRVDLHLSAHDQNYERTLPLVFDGHDFTTARHGTVFAKVGPGGKRSNLGCDFSRLPRELPDIVAASHDRAHHYALVTVHGPNALTLSVFAVADGATRLVDRVLVASQNRLQRGHRDHR